MKQIVIRLVRKNICGSNVFIDFDCLLSAMIYTGFTDIWIFHIYNKKLRDETT